MGFREITLRLSDVTLAALAREARAEDSSVNHIILDAIDRDLGRRAPAKTPVMADERLAAPLRALLADDFAFANGWEDLVARLAQKGFLPVES